MLTKTKAVVLKSLKYGDKKIFVDMFSEEYGIITFSCSSGSRSRRSPILNLLQPLSIVEVEFDMKPKSSIHAIKDIKTAIPLISIPFDAHKLSIVLFLAEFLKYLLANEQQNTVLFNYLVRSIQWLDSAESGFANFHIIFMAKMSQFSGVLPNTDSYYPGAWFDMREGTFVHRAPLHKQVLRPEEASLLPLLTRLTFSTMHLLQMSRSERNECTEQMLQYYQLHIPNFPTLRSFSVLKELFV